MSAVGHRAGIFEMIDAAEEAVLRPREIGRWSHALRAALAARQARMSGADDLAATYLEAAGDAAGLADPSADGVAEGLGPVVAFMDKVAVATGDVAAADVVGLQAAGVADADIVRLCELNAFVAFKIRVVLGLQLMAEGA